MTAHRIALSGATGYLGGKLLSAFAERGDAVAAVVRPPERRPGLGAAERVLSTSLEPEAFAEAIRAFAPNRIVHVAAAGGLGHGSDDVGEILDANLVLGARLLDAAAGVEPVPAFIGIGTFWQVGTTQQGRGPNSLYTASKSALAEIARHYTSQRGMCCRFLLPTDIYGPGDGRGRILTLLRDHVGGTATLGMTAGEQEVSFVHVDDVVGGVLATVDMATEPGTHARYLVRGPEVATLRATIGALQADLGVEIDIDWGARPYRQGEVMTFEHLPLPPGWEPAVQLTDAFRELLGEPA